MLLILLAVLAQNAQLPTDPTSAVQEMIRDPEETVLELADRNSYVLGPGDIVAVVVAGGSSQYLMSAGLSPWALYAVGGDGYLSVAGIGAVSVDGLTIEESQMALQRTASSYYSSVTVTLSLQEPRLLRVNLGGMVNMPGTYVLSALDRVSDALYMAGGISTFGSRRGVMYVDSGDSLEIDLNMVPGTATFVSDPFLRNNADIMIGVCEEPVFILSPARGIETRDLEPGDDVSALLARMGGAPGNMNLRSSVILRHGDMFHVWTDSSGFSRMSLQPGDTLMVVTLKDSIVVGGAVNTPGLVCYNPENTVSDYIVYAGGPLSTSGGGVTVYRNGIEVSFEGDAMDARPLPGDVIELNYSWFERNDALISLITSAISLGITLYSISTR
ncbi:MAG: polysaccharide biosynthesis/export family protein [Candidatus Fermentibacteraceae bacterium]|nr:polysaccharide biosynthesis/export family protein [Candidatus Fermentibacteraceae bacterium]MBN2609433.1 polysaccharide biosynthesis/export family protein [Candidatus Fermentibacteraceae bacterium]